MTSCVSKGFNGFAALAAARFDCGPPKLDEGEWNVADGDVETLWLAEIDLLSLSEGTTMFWAGVDMANGIFEGLGEIYKKKEGKGGL